jgi:hypothetical protein
MKKIKIGSSNLHIQSELLIEQEKLLTKQDKSTK